jgi:hypothetical protein
MKVILNVLFVFLTTASIAGQNIYSYSSGNGYSFEIAVAKQAWSCISKGCFSGLKRSMFIDENTESDENIITQTIDSLSSAIIELNDGFSYDFNMPSLTFYKTYCLNSANNILFQIKLELMYKSGLLSAKSIKFIDKDFVLTPPEFIMYDYEKNQGSKTNIPPPPPPAAPSQKTLYITRDINLCSDCTEKKVITIDQNRKYWLHEKYKYDIIQQIDDDILRVKKNNLWGVINYENKELIPIIYDKIEMMGSKYSKVFKGGKMGLYFDGEIILSVGYDELKSYSIRKEGKIYLAFIAKKDNLYGFFDNKGAVIIPVECQELDLFYSKYLKLKKNGLYGVVKVNGDVLYKPIYKEINFEPFAFHGVMKVATKKGKGKTFVLIEENGETAIKKVKK